MVSLRARVLAHVETWRLLGSLNAGLTAVAGAVLTDGGRPSVGVTLVVFAVPVVGFLAALYGADFKDREDDRRTRPQRPLPSGRITEDQSVICMTTGIVLGFLGASWLGFPAVVLSCVAFLVGLARTLTKSSGFVAPIFRSLGASANLLFGSVAVDVSVGVAAWLAVALLFAETLPMSIVGSLWDLDADRATGVRTPWVVHGIGRPRAVVLALLGVVLALVVVFPLLTDVGAVDYTVFAVLFAGMVLVAGWKLFQVEHDRPAALQALQWLFRGRSVLCGALIAGSTGLVPALIMVLPVMGISELSRVALVRPRMYRLDPSAAAGSR